MARVVIDLIREISYLCGSILFVIGAVATQINSATTISTPVYVACAACYVVGSAVGTVYVVRSIVVGSKDYEQIS